MGTAVSFSRGLAPPVTQPGSEHTDQDRPRVPRRRRWWLLAVAVILAAVAGFGNYALISGQDQRVDVLVVTRDVPWGQPISPGDLGVAKAVPDQRFTAIPAHDRSRVVGEFARSRLPAGAMLTPGQLTAQPVPGPGERLVGLPVKPGHLPARGLSPGTVVEVRPVAGGPSGDTGQNVDTGQSVDPAGFRARVVRVGAPGSDGAVTVDVVVGPDAAPAATSAATGQVVLVQLGPGA